MKRDKLSEYSIYKYTVMKNEKRPSKGASPFFAFVESGEKVNFVSTKRSKIQQQSTIDLRVSSILIFV
jgi:hypothetical protein